MADSILIQFRIPKKHADNLVKHTNELSDKVGWEITPSSFVKSQTIRWLEKQYAKPEAPKKDLKELLENWGKR